MLIHYFSILLQFLFALDSLDKDSKKNSDNWQKATSIILKYSNNLWFPVLIDLSLKIIKNS